MPLTAGYKLRLLETATAVPMPYSWWPHTTATAIDAAGNTVGEANGHPVTWNRYGAETVLSPLDQFWAPLNPVLPFGTNGHTVVANRVDDQQHQRAYALNASVLTDLNTLFNAADVIATCVNAQGVVVGSLGRAQITGVSSALPGSGEAFLWDGDLKQPPHLLGKLPGHTTSVATGISNSGVVCGTSSQGGYVDARAFIKRPGQGLLDLGPGLAASSSRGGKVAGAVYYQNSYVAAVWDTNQSQPSPEVLPVSAPGVQFIALGVNDAGEAVGMAGPWATKAFFYRSGVIDALENLVINAANVTEITLAQAINDDGFIAAQARVQQGDLRGETACLLEPISALESRPPSWKQASPFFGVVQDAHGLIFVPGVGLVPVPPHDPLRASTAEAADVYLAMASLELAGRLQDEAARDRARRTAMRNLESAVRLLRQRNRRENR